MGGTVAEPCARSETMIGSMIAGWRWEAIGELLAPVPVIMSFIMGMSKTATWVDRIASIAMGLAFGGVIWGFLPRESGLLAAEY